MKLLILVQLLSCALAKGKVDYGDSPMPSTGFQFTFPPLPSKPTFPTLPPSPFVDDKMLDANCLACICQSSSGNCNLSAGCSNTTGFCGPYQLSYTFYKEECSGFIVGNVINITIPFVGGSQQDFERCASDKTCSERCISRYMTRNGYSCNRGYTPTCTAFQRVPFGGSSGCNSQMAQSFWNEVTQCYDLRDGANRSPSQPRNDNPSTWTFTNAKPVNRKCLDCLCKAESNCNEKVGCVGSFCGPYQLSWNYYIECQVDGGGYAKCVNDKACAELCIQRYVQKYTSACVEAGKNATCEDHVRIHRGAATSSCRLANTADYWTNKVEKCFKSAGNELHISISFVLLINVMGLLSCF